MLLDRFSTLVAAGLLIFTTAARAQGPTEALISNYSQSNQSPNIDFFDLSQRVAWDFTTGTDAYSNLFLTVQASNNDGSAHYLTAEFFTSSGSAPDTLVGSLDIPVRFTEGFFQDLISDPAALSLAAHTTYWVVLSLADPLDNPGSPGILLRRIADASTDAGGIYSSVGGTPLLSSTNNGSTWVAENGSDAVKYLLEGTKLAIVVPVVPPDAVITAQIV